MTKSIFVAGLLLLTSACSNQNGGVADSSDVLASSTLTGKEFCRTVETGGGGGEPAGKREHCVKFLAGKKVEDNANTFFGNPPQNGTYSVVGKTITLNFEDKVVYILSKDGESISSKDDKIVLTLKGINSLDGKKFCRMVETGGMFGQPAGKREHCIKFLEGKKVEDNADTFFGNPPEKGTYSLVGKTIILNFENNVVYELSSDGKRISSVAKGDEDEQKIVLELKK